MHVALKTSLLAGALAVAAAAHADFTYNVNQVFGSSSVVGTISADIGSGVVSTNDITAFSLTLQTPTDTEVVTGGGGGFQVYIEGDSLTAVGGILYFNYSNTSGDLALFQNPLGYEDKNFLCLVGSGANCDGFGSSSLDISGDDAIISVNALTGNLPLDGSVAPTPEPSSLVLLGTGILSAAGAARRKFRKA